MGIDESKPISTLVAPSSSKKFVSSTPVVTLPKNVANTPSMVDARSVVRTDFLGIARGGVDRSTSDKALLSETSMAEKDFVSSRVQSTVFLTMLGN
jgi:hypothetical protein